MKFEKERRIVHEMNFGKRKKPFSMTLTEPLIVALDELADKLKLSRSVLIEVAILKLLRPEDEGAWIEELAMSVAAMPPERPKKIICNKCMMSYHPDAPCDRCAAGAPDLSGFDSPR